MRETRHRMSPERLAYWLGAALLALTLKQFFSTAPASQLQWQLYPLIVMLELFSDLSFELAADFAWRDPLHRINIVKGCAGINFLIISFLGYCGLRAQKNKLLWQLPVALIFAWLTALLANTVRILLCIEWQDAFADVLDTSTEDSHRFLGIASYFLCLWGQLATFRSQNIRHTALFALYLYLAVTVAVPALRAWILGLDNQDSDHLTSVIGIPILIVLISLLIKSLVRKNRACLVIAKTGLPKPG